jgi:DNA polymerase III epsilon subunit-like protein
LVLESLVNPGRRMACTHVHGITDRDVADAPRFEDVAGRLLAAVVGCAVAAYNAAFDLRFLEYELGRVGCRHPFPHLCLMYLRPMLGLGKRCGLAAACRAHQVAHGWAHAAAPDARAAADLWTVYREAMVRRGVTTFADLAALKSYKFAQSFNRKPHPAIPTGELLRAGLKPRAVRPDFASRLSGPARVV